MISDTAIDCAQDPTDFSSNSGIGRVKLFKLFAHLHVTGETVQAYKDLIVKFATRKGKARKVTLT